MHASLDSLIKKLARMPGLGPRSARRAVLYLLKNRDRLMIMVIIAVFVVTTSEIGTVFVLSKMLVIYGQWNGCLFTMGFIMF